MKKDHFWAAYIGVSLMAAWMIVGIPHDIVSILYFVLSLVIWPIIVVGWLLWRYTVILLLTGGLLASLLYIFYDKIRSVWP